MAQVRFKWCTPARQSQLVTLFQESKGFCVYGDKPCPFEEHHYEVHIEGLIQDWVDDDRKADIEAWKAEQRRFHITTEPRGRPNSQFDSVAREAFLLNRPMFYLESVGIDALKRQPVARVRVAGTAVRLFVFLPFKTFGRRGRKRDQVIHHHCNLAVKDWLKEQGMI
ncbi:MAG: hypothetical protein HW388_1230 [Dehalococcoidia bacterium]|nr:hypothetical protein [Dehalococcoidia bacterium]